MIERITSRFHWLLASLVALPLVVTIPITGAVAQTGAAISGDVAPATLQLSVSAGKYVVEFRARNNSLTGHAYVAIARAAPAGRSKWLAIFGFYPSGGADGAVQSLLGVSGVVGNSAYDRAGVAVIRRRLVVDAGTARRILATARRWQGRKFDLFVTNCNAFIADIARVAGIRAPTNTAQLPVDFVAQIATGGVAPGSVSAGTTGIAAAPEPASQPKTANAAAFAQDSGDHPGAWSYLDEDRDR